MIEATLRHRLGAFALDLSFRSEGGVVALFGASGAGKTTVANLIAGLLRPDAGRIVVGGRELFDSERGINVPPERRRLGYVFQEDRLFPHMSVRRNLTYGRRPASATDPRVTLDQVVDILGLSELLGRRPAGLSGGEKQRVAIGRALLANPRLLVMDEPLTNLDAARRAEILGFVERLRDTFAIPILYVSHSVEEIVRLADQVVAIAAGQVIAAGSVEDVMSRRELSPILGPFDAGAVMAAHVEAHDRRFELTRLSVKAGTLTVSRIDLPVGARLRVRVRARDVILARTKPEHISTLNVLSGTVVEVAASEGPQAEVLLDVGSPLWARVTRRSVEALGLVPGIEVHALIKAVAIDREATGYGGATLSVDDHT